MIKFSNLIFEKFEIPPNLQKQLENTGYSALGYILKPQIDKFRKKLFSNKELNEKSYTSLKNIIDTIKTITTDNVGNTTLTYADVLVAEYYSTTSAKEQTRKCKITIEKSGNDIYVDSDEKKDKIFPSLVVSKDYAGWDLKKVNDYWKRMNESFQTFKEEFDDKLIVLSQIENKLETWRSLDKAKKPRLNPGGDKAVLVYEKILPSGIKYEHYFRSEPSRKSDTSEYPDYFSSSGGSQPDTPIIVQTVYFDEFNTSELHSVGWFLEAADSFVNTSKHEGRHLMQHDGNVRNKLKGDFYGGPKKKLRHQYNPDVRGTNSSGASTSTSKQTDSEDSFNRVYHPHRDVEFKTNLYDYKKTIESILGSNFPKSKWKEGFKDLLSYIAGKLHYTPFNQKFRRGGTSWPHSVAGKHLKELYDNDRPKFNQVVKELYKLIFDG